GCGRCSTGTQSPTRTGNPSCGCPLGSKLPGVIEPGGPGDPPPRPLTSVAAAWRALSKLAPRGGHPTRAVLAVFAGFILLGALVLMLPVATASGESTGFATALFTSTSAVCVTGLTVVDTEVYWSE